jgi:hypothetical protein
MKSSPHPNTHQKMMNFTPQKSHLFHLSKLFYTDYQQDNQEPDGQVRMSFLYLFTTHKTPPQEHKNLHEILSSQ